MRRYLVLCAAVIAASAVACQSTKPPPPAPAAPKTSEFDDGPPSPSSSKAAPPALDPVYFDFDRAEIRNDMRNTLRTDADAIKAERGWGVITLEGHCDERGSEEYNLALGDRRAMSVKRYLVDLGVPANRLDTVSFGEAKPAVMGHTESAWRYNRRVDFGVGE